MHANVNKTREPYRRHPAQHLPSPFEVIHLPLPPRRLRRETPHLYITIVTPTDNFIVTQRHARHRSFVPYQRILAIARIPIPDLDRPIMTRACDSQFVNVQTPYAFDVAEEGTYASTGAHVPDLERVVERAGDEHGTRFLMLFVGGGFVTGARVGGGAEGSDGGVEIAHFGIERERVDESSGTETLLDAKEVLVDATTVRLLRGHGGRAWYGATGSSVARASAGMVEAFGDLGGV